MGHRLKVGLLSLFSWIVFAVAGPLEAAQLLGVRFGPKGDVTRVVFDLKGAPDYAIYGDDSGNGRLIIDFSDLSLSPADQAYRPGQGHIGRYGFAAAGEEGARAVLDFNKTAKIKEVFVLEPAGAVTKHRLVVDLETADMAAFLASLPSRYPDLTAVIEQATAPAPATAEPPAATIPPSPTQKEVAAPPPERLTVVIDPGHGGADPGAQGQSGTLEKNVNLAAALLLAEILEKRGRYKIVLTRTGDTRIRPDARETLARNAGADLFISLHADAIAQRELRGASVYTLSEQGSERSARIAKEEGDYVFYDLDASSYGEDVGGILLKKAQDKTNTASSLFAEALIENLSGKTPLLNRTHRTGDLRVLLAPDVPAVLLEMAFISNAKDEANLNSPVWRARAMKAVADSIDAYFEEYGDRRYASNRAGGAY